MTDTHCGLHRLIRSQTGTATASTLLRLLDVDARLVQPLRDEVSQAELAFAVSVILYHQLCLRVPEARQYTEEALQAGTRVVFDHGALRTVAWPSGALPAGEASITRVLRPLGYVLAGTYPLSRLKMTGRAWKHAAFPETIAQFFVSELRPEQFSPVFQSTVTRVLAESTDPLGPHDLSRLQRLERDGNLPWHDALSLLPKIIACFDRHHGPICWDDYQALRTESAEMAWISTEGNVFNHATDRVPDIDATSAAQRAKGRSIKAEIETSASGRVRQTAFQATMVERQFLHEGDWITQKVPGSFYEFIQRSTLPSGALDLAFDSSNATAIFKMTAGE